MKFVPNGIATRYVDSQRKHSNIVFEMRNQVNPFCPDLWSVFNYKKIILKFKKKLSKKIKMDFLKMCTINFFAKLKEI